ncbi:MAG TPA: hypothetical protein VEL74_05160 [Thermoanaerobaculia bacterium]|nr:hypothetical protein [Thermoanaerobaculia bacterium]
MSPKVRSLVTLALLALLVAGPAAALPVGGRTPSMEGASVFSGVWDWFSSLVSGLWGKAGSSMDPDGPPASNKAGSSMDPNGAPTPGEEGGSMDPDGLNATGCTTEAGGTMDPNGKPIPCPAPAG